MIESELSEAQAAAQKSGKPARCFKEFQWSTLDSWSRERRVVAKAEWTQGEANPRFVVTSLSKKEAHARRLYEKLYCARGDMENRIKECQLDLFADRTSTATMCANQLRLWFASFAYVLVCALWRIALKPTQFAKANCATIRLKLLKIGALVRGLGPTHQARHGLILPQPARIQDHAHQARRRGALKRTTQRTVHIAPGDRLQEAADATRLQSRQQRQSDARARVRACARASLVSLNRPTEDTVEKCGLAGKRGGLTRMGGSCGAGAFWPACARAGPMTKSAREQQLTPERVRQIVREALAQRIVDDETDHAKLQFARLAQAMQIASMAVADGDVKVIPAFLKVLDRLDRYRRASKVNAVYDDEARKRLFDKINRVAANLGLDHARTADGGVGERGFGRRGRERGGERKNALAVVTGADFRAEGESKTEEYDSSWA